MENTAKPMFRYALNWGIIIGLVVVILSLLAYMIGMDKVRSLQWINLLIMLGLIVVAQVQYKNNNPGIEIGYGRMLGLALLVGLFASVVLAIYNYIFMTFIAPEFLEFIRQQGELSIMNQEMPASAREKALEMQEKFTQPWVMSAFTIFQMEFMVFVGALLTSIFTKGTAPAKPDTDDTENETN
jgi:hypothetical protein